MPERLVVGKAGQERLVQEKLVPERLVPERLVSERRVASRVTSFAVFLKKTRNPPPKKTILNQFKQKNNLNQKKPEPNIKPVQQRKFPKRHNGAFKHLQPLFSDKTHGNNFFGLHKPPELFTKTKTKAELRPKMYPK